MNSLIIGILAALVSAFSWASATILVRMGLKRLSPISANILRLYVAALTFLVIFLATNNMGVFRLSPRLLLVAFISAQFGFVIGDYFYFSALKRMGVSRTVPITSTYPLWAILWAVLFLDRKVSPQVVIGALLVVTAIIIVRRAEEEEQVDGLGFIYALLAPISWSVAITLLDYLSSDVPVLQLAGIRMMFAAIGISILLPKYYGEIRSITIGEFLTISGAAVLGLILGQYLFVYSVSSVGSPIAAPVSAINPIISSLLAVLLLGEKPNRRIFEGLALAVAGIILISTG
ncbi:permease, drug/metabolite transporter (DMT) superfamily [Thermococcus kodakarensis KOD1]|uniref:Permease, drug/metabolite transporter (DMT) superfamily n=1 Tax=Thermococcus kodakarensis (strain ATCC BAA-918 / JCM 12380 / KOD1) TaxID=69014 RepID=Q5JGL1_THEKO|nr:DMT family transporter [Thermococcus kodakarensis]WCN27267.1 DMT family transporter [Thermococcus kodakarensis]WCN29553.1 DMT family transporter [Thermococcus kodakarensis]BAD85456.1 permease, drug/metabolite transporter (DMT) superfamily [Thermococcus kodakarensis KOD1]